MVAQVERCVVRVLCRQAQRLMSSDGLVLGQLIRCLAVVLQCHGGGDVASERMARTLLGETFWELYRHV
jgi:hypothetical protein